MDDGMVCGAHEKKGAKKRKCETKVVNEPWLCDAPEASQNKS